VILPREIIVSHSKEYIPSRLRTPFRNKSRRLKVVVKILVQTQSSLSLIPRTAQIPRASKSR